ncbi:hypothetical protein BGZ70_008211 [Mortierella alpina]|uniref:Uncharacterized protein n=1 Tax=Mortierella alpina TaxID=64518 RepID=A0A9P6J4G4_MORAP|nr:hypothetical protein BGZ70_008211 [Mortierella alpina]
MRFTTIALALGAVVATVSAAPMPTNNGSFGGDVPTALSYALTLERFSHAFYEQGLAKYDAKAFTDAGFAADVRERLAEIGMQENGHVEVISGALEGMKAKPVPACEYNFPVDTLTNFLAGAQYLETVGTSAYLGALPGLSGDLLVVAAGITTAEARHSAYVNVLWKQLAAPYAIDTPLSPREVVTLVSPWIKGCPYDIGVKPFNMLTASLSKNEGNATKVITSFMGPKNGTDDKTFCQFRYGSKFASSPRSECVLPADVRGYVYVTVASTDKPITRHNEKQVLAGPTVLFNVHNDTASNPM